jgi:AcrR family transcriptional regulator
VATAALPWLRQKQPFGGVNGQNPPLARIRIAGFQARSPAWLLTYGDCDNQIVISRRRCNHLGKGDRMAIKPETRAEQRKVARRPSQERSRLRYEALLDATDALIRSRGMTNFGIYEIAAEAEVPTASAYHFFPSTEAAFSELARRYLAVLAEQTSAPVAAQVVASGGWQDLVRLRFERAVQFYRSHEVARLLFLSGDVVSSIRRVDVDNTLATARRLHDFFDRYFVMPAFETIEFKLLILVSIYDGCWMASVAKSGDLTADYCDEAIKAGLLYCASFLPETLPRR